ncbi:hypothetical protein AMK26_32210 [Streptomyces sp. CB03234]|uniref:PRC-barrel domain-containing protein n=1 Tax=Streptomyces sp. (strain CB03234) TaxID=1703937 RepID=UPI00093B947E|nr:PRC-barrel domain-containing protein [Streptomyces sp. CB03234]OKJ94498.1 hypothetical protein AMK26_32210 [Streptomyces sp. CB03234]
MKASELLNADVLDESGQRLGTVHDLRVVRTSGADHWQLQAIIVGATGLTHRLGYATDEVRGPFLLAKVASWIARRRQVIEWSRVISYDKGRITVHASQQPRRQP